MCLIVNKEFSTREEAENYKPLIAKKDITVYKILHISLIGTYYSPFFSFKYEKGFQYTEDELCRDIYMNHFASNHVSNQYRKGPYSIHIEQGLHAYLTPNNGYLESSSKSLVKMIVPKGSEYYLGTNNDIVSNNLIWY